MNDEVNDLQETAEVQDVETSVSTDDLAETSESMDDLADELEVSYKEFDERQNQTFVPEDSPNADKWQEMKQMQADKTVVKVKVKEIVKGGAIAYVDGLRAFIPASQFSFDYVEKLDDWVGKYLETYIITVEPEKKRLVLSARELLKERRDAERQEKMAGFKPGMVVDGTVESIKDYGAFINLADGVTGLLHISQISNQRIKHPSAVLKEGQQVKVRILSVDNGKISLSMKTKDNTEKEKKDSGNKFEYKDSGDVTTGLGDLLKNIQL